MPINYLNGVIISVLYSMWEKWSHISLCAHMRWQMIGIFGLYFISFSWPMRLPVLTNRIHIWFSIWRGIHWCKSSLFGKAFSQAMAHFMPLVSNYSFYTDSLQVIKLREEQVWQCSEKYYMYITCTRNMPLSDCMT